MYAGVLELLYGFHGVDDRTAGADADIAGLGVEVLFHCLSSGGAFGGFNGRELGSTRGRHIRDGGFGDGLCGVHCIWEKMRHRS